jgi:hypothetical protein
LFMSYSSRIQTYRHDVVAKLAKSANAVLVVPLVRMELAQHRLDLDRRAVGILLFHHGCDERYGLVNNGA